MRPWSLISPASRGIGLALTRQVLQTTNVPVVATARKDLDAVKRDILKGLDVNPDRLKMLEVDFLEESTLAAAAAACKEAFPLDSHHLHLSFILPGILFPEKSPAQIDADSTLLTFRTNTIGPMLMLKHFSPFLPRKASKQNAKSSNRSSEEDGPSALHEGLPPSAIMALMSARVGSVSDNRLGGWYSYRASKAAVNQVVKTFDNHLRNTSGDRAFAVGLHPGTVKTEFSREFWGNVREGKLFGADHAAERLLDVIKGIGVEGRGRCWDWEGKEVLP
ncbi:short-chain dehydrogenase/reductase-like protein [Aaosphaeria arxii CBS 175.79]|uniref:Short-chain dehydrogenase/reductase-like protein n=1 Tax=Aaosphaeria arxii CBS 175.79 TaxID=1450172 RepID=A0A6A5XWB9_9PLEO|nr:short-chain dehydrogenase/reductase-like protein [Aaosphaeria arxii CBS 175.79]KAF2017462.1 short-chain dehydrogenase/reductase-like protein [Aaosphaeria arxii CBS 175.79]